jgi:hypothetical protein
MSETSDLSRQQWRDMVDKLIAQLTRLVAHNVLLRHRVRELEAQLKERTQ